MEVGFVGGALYEQQVLECGRRGSLEVLVVERVGKDEQTTGTFGRMAAGCN